MRRVYFESFGKKRLFKDESPFGKFNYSLTTSLMPFDSNHISGNSLSHRNQETLECTLLGSSVYGLEKALVFQDLMKDLKDDGFSIGYEIYSGFAYYTITNTL